MKRISTLDLSELDGTNIMPAMSDDGSHVSNHTRPKGRPSQRKIPPEYYANPLLMVRLVDDVGTNLAASILKVSNRAITAFLKRKGVYRLCYHVKRAILKRIKKVKRLKRKGVINPRLKLKTIYL